MWSKLIKLIFIILLFLSFTPPITASETINAHLFYGVGCPHCAKEQIFLNSLMTKYPQLKLTEYEIYYHKENNALLQQVAQSLKIDSGGVPFLVIGDQGFIGYTEGISQTEIENKIIACSEVFCGDVVTMVANLQKPKPTDNPIVQNDQKPTDTTKFINIPFFGSQDISKFSLPVLTIILAFLDGFNPCAMWTLLFLISLLLGLKDRRRMWILGVAFIATSAFVYFLFLSAWLNLFLFLGFVVWIRTLIGIIALAAGYYYLRDYWVNKKGGCNVMGDKKRQLIFEKLRTITQNRKFILALGGIMLLAIAVNMVELICSAGLPAIYTQILSLAHLPRWQYYLYLLLYVFIFMLDDLFIFFTAMITMRAVGVQSKYSRYSHLIGGILMVIIGLLLLFKPEWLMFG